MPSKVLILMSGGVDSSTAAAILSKSGHDVIGLTMKVWDEADAPNSDPNSDLNSEPELARNFDPDPDEQGEPSNPCCSLADVEDARRICARLKIPHYVSNAKAAFMKSVVDPFCEEYLEGRTPNPCILCNTEIKFRLMLDKASALGADLVATGHYARIERDDESGRLLLLKGLDASKDQSYFLYDLTQDQLGRMMFPLGALTKEQVRAKARELGLSVAQKPESQEICFVPDGDYRGLLDRLKPGRIEPGPIIDVEGNELGRHKGIAHYTIGQRRGLGISHPRPLYVIGFDLERHAVIVGEADALSSSELVAERLRWISIEKLEGPMRIKARIRHRHEASPATITPIEDSGKDSEKDSRQSSRKDLGDASRADSPEDFSGSDRVRVEFDEPQRAITPGQAVVFYDGDVVVGGGVIESAR
jgi:tRNA-specific 2-thiouridylase